MRKLEVREQFGNAKVFETMPDGFEAVRATFDNREDADLFVAIATAEVKYQPEILSSDGTWFWAGCMPTPVQQHAQWSLDAAKQESERFHPNRQYRLALVRTISEQAPALEEA